MFGVCQDTGCSGFVKGRFEEFSTFAVISQGIGRGGPSKS
jgi:hypothetical protein